MQMKHWRRFLIGVAFLALLTSACANDGQVRKQQQSQPLPLNEPDQGNDAAVIPIVNQNNQPYLSLNELMNLLEFKHKWDEQRETYLFGEEDIVFEVTMNSTQAVKENTEINLSNPPMKQGSTAYIPLDAIGLLFEEEMNYTVNDQGLVIYPYVKTGNAAGSDLDFADDPSDPAGTEEYEGNAPDIGGSIVTAQSISALGIKDINVNQLIATGKKYLGVDYEFGAGPYSSSGTFDCSSFVQQLYETYGVNMPRLARSQAKRGVSVSRSNLRKGDLLFFYVPGRFKSNRTVGHVGIYIGNGKMLHSSPQPKDGVQITNINKPYWKETYMGAKRVVK